MSSNKKELEIALAAVKLFEQKGYRATSVQDIADEVGLQKGSLYHYIQSKEDLLLQIAHQAITEFNARLEDVLALPITAKRSFLSPSKVILKYPSGIFKQPPSYCAKHMH